MYLKSQNEAAVENSRRVPTKDEARKWYADIKPIILCTDQGDNNKGAVLKSCWLLGCLSRVVLRGAECILKVRTKQQ